MPGSLRAIYFKTFFVTNVICMVERLIFVRTKAKMMANFIETETTADGVTYYTKKVGTSIYNGVVEPTFTDGEWAAIFTDDFNDAVTEKMFTDEDEAHFWVMRKMLKAN